MGTIKGLKKVRHPQALEAVEKLKANLRQEQTLLIQSLCQGHQAILAPEQVRVATF